MQQKVFWHMIFLAGICTSACYASMLIITGGVGWATGLAAVAVIMLIGVLVAKIVSASIVSKAISSANRREGYNELSPLFKKIEEQRSTIKSAETNLQERNMSFRLIVESMHEGVILLDNKGIVVSENSSAAKLMGHDADELIGKHIYLCSSAPAFQAAVDAALGGKGSDELLEISGSAIELAASPVFVDGVARGAVMLLFDVTERIAAEQMRREFSANVSHELKTPLTSISGYAEIIKDGLVKDEDVPRFAGKVYSEAQRLIALIEDIIKLSRLDEGREEIKSDDVSLLDTAREVSERLGEKAEDCGVSIIVSGDNTTVRGNPQLIEEMLYNLCDNAVKYNRRGGTVEMTVSEFPKNVLFEIKDTGIGIPKEHQSRVFERFYRVDKSHSRDTGGTGLGLSIVKHAAAFHNAEIDLESSSEKGTYISIKFPKIQKD